MWKCKCNTKNDDEDDYCIKCGMPKPSKAEMSSNHCSNPKCMAYNVLLPDAEQMHCGKCGSLTTYGKKIDDLT